jgi:hypothetical protein
MKLTRLLSSPTAFLTVAASIGVATVVSSAAPASAISNPITLNFVCASSTTATYGFCATGASQFSAVVSPVATNPGRVKFSFMNVGTAPSSIIKLDIFDKTQYSLGNRVSVTGIPSSASGSVVSFGSGAKTTSGTINRYAYAATRTGATQRNRGINSGESLDIILDIANAPFRKPFNAVVTDLFKKGLSVQLTASGFGAVETQRNTQVVFNSKVKAVPEPLTLLGSGAALGFGALMKRRSSKLKAKKAGNTPVESTLEAVA